MAALKDSGMPTVCVCVCERERERERNKRVEEKGETSWGEGQVECFHTCQDGMALVAAVSTRLHVL